MAKFTKKITNLIDQQVPEFVLSDHPKFLEFVKTYFKFMESAEIIVDNIELTVVPQSNDIVPVRDQVLEIDIANSSITVSADAFVGGSSDAGVGYTTSSSY